MGFDPDITRRDDAPYWAARLVMAVRRSDHVGVRFAQANLRRLGIRLTVDGWHKVNK